jgi:hypothetical protein
MYKLTLDGIDVMGERLAQEVSSSFMHISYVRNLRFVP